MSKRPREEEESTTMVTDTEITQEDTSRAPIPKKLRIIQRVGPEVRKGATQKSVEKIVFFVVFDNLRSVGAALILSCFLLRRRCCLRTVLRLRGWCQQTVKMVQKQVRLAINKEIGMTSVKSNWCDVRANK